jgi:flagellar hook-basal body complex protein FliE
VRPIGSFVPPTPPTMPGALGRVLSPTGGIGATNGPPDATSDFAKLMLGKFEEVNTMQTDADDMVHDMLTGGNVNQAEVLTAVQKADLAFRMMLQVRNKLIEAYRELQQIQI